MPVAEYTGLSVSTGDSTVCPFISNPDPECHCYHLGNADVSSLMYFCGRNYQYCDRYQKRIQGSDAPSSSRS